MFDLLDSSQEACRKVMVIGKILTLKNPLTVWCTKSYIMGFFRVLIFLSNRQFLLYKAIIRIKRLTWV